MSLIYITGIAGAGKSATCDELTRRGYEAHEADNTLSAFYVNSTGEMLNEHIPVSQRLADWRDQHTWKMSRDKLLDIKRNSGGKLVFVCGVAGNEEEYIDVFDDVFALSLDLPTLKERIATRESGDFGKSDHEMQILIEWYKSSDEYYLKIGAKVIDASQPPEKVVDEILRHLIH